MSYSEDINSVQVWTEQVDVEARNEINVKKGRYRCLVYALIDLAGRNNALISGYALNQQQSGRRL